MAKRSNYILLSISLIIFLSMSTFLLTNLLKNPKISTAPVIQTKALDCYGYGTNDDPQCDDANNPCKFSCNPQLNNNPIFIPACCDEVQRTGDPTKCCFAALRMCTPKQCSTIPADVRRLRCAQLWEVGCCPIVMEGCGLQPPGVTPAPRVPYDDFPTSTPATLPTATLIPSSPTNPSPTSLPYISPTSSVYYPSLAPSSSQVPSNYPTAPPYTYPTAPLYFPPTNPPYSTQIPQQTSPTSYLPPTLAYTSPGQNTVTLPQTPLPNLGSIFNRVGSAIEKVKNNIMEFFRVVLP